MTYADNEGAKLKAKFDLLKTQTGMSKAEFARTYGVPGGASVISQNISGHRPISLKGAAAYMRGFDCGMSDISPTLAAQLPKGESAPTGALVQDAWREPSFEDAVRVIALRLTEADDATRRRAVNVLVDIAEEPKDHERIAKAVLAVIDTGKRRTA